VPPLRERKEDIPLLASEFVNEFCIREGKSVTLAVDVSEYLRICPWPGNVRQLRNVMERAVVLSKGDRISMKDLPPELYSSAKKSPSEERASISGSEKTLRELECQAIKDALESCGGNKSKASRALGISRKALYKRMSEIQGLG
jgi:two-component system response regulator HydG